MKSLFCLLAFAMAFSQVLAFEEDYEVQEEARFLYNTGNGMFVSLNSTYFVFGLAALAFVGFAALILFQRNGQNVFSSSHAYNRFAYEPYGEDQYYHQEHQTRQRRGVTQDVATKLAQLDSALKKYQVEEAECEMFIACEASQVHRLEENGPLAKIVNEIFSTMNPEKNYPKMTDRMANLFQSFQYGTNAYQSGQYDACQPLRNKCFELHARTN